MLAKLPEWTSDAKDVATLIGAFGVACGTVWGGVYRLHKALLKTVTQVVKESVDSITDKLSEIELRHIVNYEDHERRITRLEDRK